MERYTNVCEATSQSHDLDSYRPTHRKGKKLLAEKKRRARINNCLMQIRDIVCNGEEAKDTDIDKMEKAEILEKTLEVLTRLRHDYDSSRNSLTSHKAMAVRYASGFSSCAEESIRYIQCSRLIPTEVKHQLQAHLRSIARRMESSVHDVSMSYDLSYSSLPVMATPVPSLPAGNEDPSVASSVALLLPVSSNISSSPKVSPTMRLDFQDSAQVCTPAESNISIKPEPSVYNKTNIPSPILSSTPVLHREENETATLAAMPPVCQASKSHFSPITAHDFASEHKENNPKDNSYFCVPSSYSQEKKIFLSQGNSAFHPCTPHNSSTSSSSPKHQQNLSYYSQHSSFPLATPSASSSSSSSSRITVPSDLPVSLQSQYSPISPATSPVPSLCSTALVQPSSNSMSHLPEQQPMYCYDGYEPYPVLPVVVSTIPSSSSSSSSSSTTVLSEPHHPPSSYITPPTTAANNALDLCTKRSESHNISPETMWRPW